MTKPRMGLPEDHPDYDGSTRLDNERHELFTELYCANTLPRYWADASTCYEYAYGYTARIAEIQEQLEGTKKDRGKKSKAQLIREIKKMQHSCNVNGTKIMVYTSLKKRIAWRMDQTSEHLVVDRELLWNIQQRGDLGIKQRAIEHHDRRTNRIVEKVQMEHKFEAIDTIQVVKPGKK